MKKKVFLLVIFLFVSFFWVFVIDFILDSVIQDPGISYTFNHYKLKEFSFIVIFLPLIYWLSNEFKNSNTENLSSKISKTDIEFLSVSFNELIKSTNDGYILLNKDLYIEKFNENGDYYSGILFKKHLSENLKLTDLLPKHTGNIYDRILPSILKGNVVDLYDEVVQANGEVYNFYIRFNPVFIENRLTFVYVLIKDISLERENKRKLIEFNLTLENLLSNSRDGFISIAKNGNIKNINTSALDLFILNKKPKNLFNIAHLPTDILKSNCEKVWTNQQEINFDIYLPTTLKWLEIKIIPYWDSLSLFIQDITTDKISHQLLDIEKDALEIITKNELSFHHILSNSLDRIQNIIEGNQVCYFSFDAITNQLNYFSSGYSNFVAYEPDEIIIENLSNLILKDAQIHTAANDPYHLYESEFFKSAKQIFSYPIFDRNQHVIGVLFLMVNIEVVTNTYIQPLLKNISQITQNIFDFRENYFNLERLSLVSQSSPKGFITIDNELKVIWVNQSLLELFSIFKNEIINKDIYSVLNEFILMKRDLKRIQELIKNYESFSEEIEIKNKNNNSYWVQINGKLMFSGNDIQYLIDFENITERKKQNEIIRENALFLQKITDSVPFVLFQYQFDENKTFKFPFISNGILKLNSHLNIQELQTDGSKFYTIIDPKYIFQLKYKLIKGYFNKKAWDYEFIMFNENSRKIWIKILAVPRIETNGNILWYGSLEDITQKKEISQKMQESELKHKKLFDTSKIGIIYYDKKGNIIETNSAVQQILNTPKKKSLTLKTIKSLRVIDENNQSVPDMTYVLKLAIDAKKTVENYILGVYITKNNDELIWLNTQVFPIFTSNKSEPEYYVSMIEDITEKYTSQKKIEESNMRFTMISNAVNEAIWDWDIQSDAITWSEGFGRLFGYSKEEYPIRKNWAQYFHKEDFNKSQEYYLNTINNSNFNRWENEYRILKKNGEYAYVTDRAYIIREKNGKAKRIIGSLQDISEKRNFELQKSALINTTQEEERKRFSMELHDGLAQYLVALNLYMNQIDNEGKLNYEILDLCKRIIQDGLNLTRALCYSLSPPELNNGLIPGVRALYERLEALNKINFTIIHKPKSENLFNEALDSYNIFRIIQEFTNNSIKYAKCSEITCLFTTERKKRTIYVKDNGVGFDIKTVKKGFGLENMEKRAKLINGQIEIISKVGVGTELKLTID